MLKNEQPDLSILVKSLEKRKAPQTSSKSVAVYLDKGIDLPTGGGGAITGEGAPTLSTEADEGQTYLDTDSGKYYVCFDVQGNDHFWTEVETETPIDKYATVEYYSKWNDSYEEEWADNCIINSIDTDKFTAFLNEYGGDPNLINFDYHEGLDPETGEPTGEYFWMFWGEEGEVIIYPDEMLATTGINVSIEDPEMPWAMFSLIGSVEVDTTSEVLSVDVFDKNEYDSMGGWDYNYTIGPLGKNKVSFPNKAVKGILLSDKLDYVPEGFCYGCENVEYVSNNKNNVSAGLIYLVQFREVGQSAFSGCQYISNVNIMSDGNDLIIKDSVLSESGDSNASWSQVGITVGNGVLKMGDGFMGQSYFKHVEIEYHGNDPLNNISRIGNGFCQNASNLENVRIAVALEKIGYSFCINCVNLLSLYVAYSDRIDEIGYSFLEGCASLNSTFILDYFGGVDKVGDYFLRGCSNLIDNDYSLGHFVEHLEYVGQGFLADCSSLGFPSLEFKSLKRMGGPYIFLYNAQISSVNFYSFAPSGTTDNFMATDDPDSDMYQRGIDLYANDTTIWSNLYPNSDQFPYRKLIMHSTGGGGGGVEYSFSDTSDGWEVAGSDGYSFSHTDMGGDIDIGKIRGLTTADYNWPVEDPTSIALWLLDNGVYVRGDDVNAVDLSIYGGAITSLQNGQIITVLSVNGEKRITFLSNGHRGQNNDSSSFTDGVMYQVNSSGALLSRNRILYGTSIVNDLTSTSTNYALSANQGKVLSDRIGDLSTLQTTAKTSVVAAINEVSQGGVINGGMTAPTASTVGTIGKLYVYVDTTGTTPEPHIVICTAVTESGGETVYTWTDLLGEIATQLNTINNGSNS